MPHNPGDSADSEGYPPDHDEPAAANAAAGNGNGSRMKPSPSATDDDDEPIGYGRPPRQHRFKPGESGNPKGRAKGAKGMKSILRKEFSERVRITENGKSRTISKMELMVKRLAEKGAKGDFKSITKLIDLGMMVFGTEDEVRGAPSLTGDEQAIIDQVKKRRHALAGSNKSTRKGRAPNRVARTPTRDTKGAGR